MNSRTTPLSLGIFVAVLMVIAAALPTPLKHSLHWQGALHFWLHGIAFAVLGFLLFSSTRSLATRLVLLVVLLGLGYGTEAFESYRDGWPIEQKDVLADTAGVFIGSLIGMVYLGKPRAET